VHDEPRAENSEQDQERSKADLAIPDRPTIGDRP
jgi:hypothetical protein